MLRVQVQFVVRFNHYVRVELEVVDPDSTATPPSILRRRQEILRRIELDHQAARSRPPQWSPREPIPDNDPLADLWPGRKRRQFTGDSEQALWGEFRVLRPPHNPDGTPFSPLQKVIYEHEKAQVEELAARRRKYCRLIPEAPESTLPFQRKALLEVQRYVQRIKEARERPTQKRKQQKTKRGDTSAPMEVDGMETQSQGSAAASVGQNNGNCAQSPGSGTSRTSGLGSKGGAVARKRRADEMEGLDQQQEKRSAF